MNWGWLLFEVISKAQIPAPSSPKYAVLVLVSTTHPSGCEGSEKDCVKCPSTALSGEIDTLYRSKRPLVSLANTWAIPPDTNRHMPYISLSVVLMWPSWVIWPRLSISNTDKLLFDRFDATAISISGVSLCWALVSATDTLYPTSTLFTLPTGRLCTSLPAKS